MCSDRFGPSIGFYDSDYYANQKIEELKSERDSLASELAVKTESLATALARANEWQGAHLEAQERGAKEAVARRAAETALASARELLQHFARCATGKLAVDTAAWLTSHPWTNSDLPVPSSPAPVAALKDASSCMGSSCDGCGAPDCWETSSARTIIERLVRPYQHTSPPGFSTVIDDARAWLKEHP